ncbi:hypothetical protein BO221_10105 [Archangium sp. Cb G35]|uniref:Ig-like domain-containing protein n=1 Tax=Archangium sp. Cb G35 TaxID=1920190 RepID=UPI000936F49B|nr:Ig-like domain-containing protein [Archangium sp. Cb G35]OJT26163.1 hypothetical protein BO221_10105 [Archangium sp. Cb G35]
MRLLVTLLAVGFVESTPPSVSLLNLPPTGAAIGDWTYTISAEASDDSGVSQVEFFVDGASLGIATAPPYSAPWDGRTAASGEHTLTAVATDIHGNAATSNPAIVTVDRAPPALSVISPTAGATLSGIIPMRVDARDDAAINMVSYSWDGRWIAHPTTPPFSLDWDSTAEADGPHTLAVTAFDRLGNSVTSTFTVNTQQPVSARYDSYLEVPVCATLAPFCDTTNLVRLSDYWEPHTPNTLRPRCHDGSIAYPYDQVRRIKVSTLSGAAFATGERVRIDAHVGIDRVFPLLDLFVASDASEPSWTLLATFEPGQRGDQVFSAEYVLPPGKLQAVRVQLRSGYANSPTPCSVGSSNDRDDVVFAVESPPQVKLTSPGNTSRLDGRVTVSAEVDFFHPVTKVEFYDGTTLLGTRTSEPYYIVWDTASVADGAHTLIAKVYDTAGREGTSPAVGVTIDNTPPDVALISPSQGAFLRGAVTIEATASDTVSVPWIELYVDTTLLDAGSGGDFRRGWSSWTVPDGLHTITVKAHDQIGHVSTASVEVSVDHTAPTVALTAPRLPSGTYLRGPIQLSATASDNLGVARVEFYRGSGILIGSVTSAPYELSWDSTTVADGSYLISVKAYDHAGNVKASDSSSVRIDNSPPAAAFAFPTQGAFLRGTVTLQAAASDNLSLALLEFYDGTTLLGTASSGRTTLTWNTAGAAQGPHTLTVKAHDKAGNVHTSAAVEVFIDNVAPATAVSAPAQNAWLRGIVPVSATASDNQGVARVEFYAGTTLLETVTTAPYTVSWDTRSGPDGSVTLTARAYDAAGNVTVSAGRAVMVDNSGPTVAITSPANGTSFSFLTFSTTVQASASDNVGVTQVVFYDGATVLGTDTTAPYSVTWNLVGAAKGTHTLTARAYDAVGNVTLSGPISVTVK